MSTGSLSDRVETAHALAGFEPSINSGVLILFYALSVFKSNENTFSQFHFFSKLSTRFAENPLISYVRIFSILREKKKDRSNDDNCFPA